VLTWSAAQLYIDFLGDLADVDYMFHPSSGLLLSEGMHKRFDRYEPSIFCKASIRKRRQTWQPVIDSVLFCLVASQGDACYIHMFILQNPADRQSAEQKMRGWAEEHPRLVQPFEGERD
jgi:hypothetical protein